MVYLAIKELANSAENMIMVTSSIMKDIQPNLEVIYRPNAIRALCRVIDVSHITFSASLHPLTMRMIATTTKYLRIPLALAVGFNDARGGKIL
jgi:hypothetical protein